MSSHAQDKVWGERRTTRKLWGIVLNEDYDFHTSIQALRIKASNIFTSGSGAFPFGCSILSCQTMGFRIMRKWKVHQASLCDTSHSSLCITRTTWSSHCSNKWRAAPDSDGCVVTWNNHIIVIVVIRYELELAPTASDLCQGYVMLNLFHPSQPKLCLFQTSPNIRLNLAYGLVALILWGFTCSTKCFKLLPKLTGPN